MLEKRLNKKTFRNLVYFFGIIIEFLGFGFLFAFEKTTQLIQDFPIIFSLILIFTGYLLAISVRKRK